MPGTSDAIAITTEDVNPGTVSPKDAFDMVQAAMASGQEAVDKLPKDIVKMAKKYAEDNLTSSRDFSAYA
tara:strand:- start:5330 stop:5539 length:210 start_codon:yes stop_codon:yes gene_type:complete